MKARILWIIGAALVCVMAVLTLGRKSLEPVVERASTVPVPLQAEKPMPTPEPVPVADRPPAPTPAPVVETAPPPAPPSAQNSVAVNPSAAPKPAQQPSRRKKPTLVDPLARDAMNWVGADADAEEYWVYAINNPDIPPKEREDLIEDLNEEGFLDPKHPTIDELPLILNRLDIILELAPYAMDEVNAKSFAEAYKDLLNMAHLAGDSGYGKPVK